MFDIILWWISTADVIHCQLFTAQTCNFYILKYSLMKICKYFFSSLVYVFHNGVDLYGETTKKLPETYSEPAKDLKWRFLQKIYERCSTRFEYASGSAPPNSQNLTMWKIYCFALSDIFFDFVSKKWWNVICQVMQSED